MIEAKKAAFKFEKYRIPSFSYNETQNSKSGLKVGFSPSGIYDPNQGTFDLHLDFIAKEDTANGNEVVKVRCIATFKFADKLQLTEIPDYFYKNSIAIVFPYLRSFISTLTLQSNTGILTLDIMNLSRLETPLRDNIKVVSTKKTVKKQQVSKAKINKT